jgi:hypothetical protein
MCGGTRGRAELEEFAAETGPEVERVMTCSAATAAGAGPLRRSPEDEEEAGSGMSIGRRSAGTRVGAGAGRGTTCGGGGSVVGGTVAVAAGWAMIGVRGLGGSLAGGSIGRDRSRTGREGALSAGEAGGLVDGTGEGAGCGEPGGVSLAGAAGVGVGELPVGSMVGDWAGLAGELAGPAFGRRETGPGVAVTTGRAAAGLSAVLVGGGAADGGVTAERVVGDGAIGRGEVAGVA